MKVKESLTWEELANKINAMSPEEKKESVKVWGEDRPVNEDVCLLKETEDLCYIETDYPDECSWRSSFDKDANIKVALEAGTYYLWY